MSNSNLRVLIVEDDNSWQQIMSEILLDFGFDVDTASSYDEAVQLVKAQAHRIAVVDLSLSPNDHNNQDGLRVLDQIRKLDPNCRTILLTGFATVEIAVTALTDYGAFTFLRKESFQRSQFKDIVKRILVSAPQPATPPTPPEVTSPFALRNVATMSPPISKAIIVDDDAGWRNILSDLLIEAGFQVHVCSGFGEAVGYLRKDKISVAVFDLSLNEMLNNQVDSADEQKPQGYQLLEITKESRIPTIVVSGISETEEIQRIYSEYSVSAYIEKQSFDRVAFKKILDSAKQASLSTDELSMLTEREREVLELLAQGLTNKEIAEKLVITTNTVKRHLKAIFEKLNVHTRSAATAKVTKR
jgi:DNA-binding NarL/FixJ family response regulator